MELWLLQALAFLRPVFFIELDVKIGGLNVFELIGILSFVVLSAAFLSNASQRKDAQFTPIDLCILLFGIWCIAAYVVYLDRSYVSDLSKLLIPLFTYTIAKNIIRTPQDYLKVLKCLMLGFAVPLVLSSIFILGGEGLDRVNYWTGLPRYEGLYANSHNMGHNATLALIVIGLYVMLRRSIVPQGEFGKKWLFLFFLIGSTALFCLYESRVRTSILGLLLFFGMYFLFFNRKLLITTALVLVVGGILWAPVLTRALFYDVEKVETGEWAAGEVGSGRPEIWKHNLTIFLSLPLDRQLAGVGIGNQNLEDVRYSPDNVINSHNDFLEVLMQTGIVGMTLFLILQVLILRRILQLEAEDRRLFLGLFFAVCVMNLASNSYIFRFGLAQMYYILLAYVELPIHLSARVNRPLASADVVSIDGVKTAPR